MLTPEEEIQLFERYWAGDISARNALVEAYRPMVLHRAPKYMPWLAVEDAVQEGFVALMIAIDRCDPRIGRLGTRADHFLMDARGKTARRHRKRVNEANDIPAGAQDDGWLETEERVELDGLRRAFDRLAAMLPERDRTVLTMRRAGKSLEECSRAVGVSRERTRQIEARAVIAMREAAAECAA
jgi:RNA polymerase sigma factor (sigma-70 family)